MGKRKESTSDCQQVVFIACSSRKKNIPGPAKELYQGSLFKKALVYSLLITDPANIYILSAKYGILSLDTKIDPYNLTLNTFTKSQLNTWYEMVKQQMIELNLNPPFLFLTGARYNAVFPGKKPLTGLTIGKQLQWFNHHTKRIGLL